MRIILSSTSPVPMYEQIKTQVRNAVQAGREGLRGQEPAHVAPPEPVRARGMRIARPVGVAGRVWRWCRRKPQVASLAGVAALAVVLGFAVVTWQWRQAEAHRGRAEQQAYISDINAAQAALKENNPGRALDLLNRQRPAGKF